MSSAADVPPVFKPFIPSPILTFSEDFLLLDGVGEEEFLTQEDEELLIIEKQ